MRHFVAGVLASVVLMSGLLAGCGSVPPSASACPTLVSSPQLPTSSVPGAVSAVTAAAREALAGPLHVTVSLSEASLIGATCTPMNGTGSFDGSTGQGDVTVAPPAASGDGAAETYTVVYDSSDIYVHLPVSQTRLFPAGLSWVDAPFGSRAATHYPEQAQSFFTQMFSMNPRLVLEELAMGNIGTATGTPARLDGVPVTEYTVAVNLTTAVVALSGAYASAFRRVLLPFVPLPGAPTTTTTTTPAARNPWLSTNPFASTASVAMDVWMGSDGALRRVTFVPPYAALGSVSMTFAGAGTSATGGTGSGAQSAAVPTTQESVAFSRLLKAMGVGNPEGAEGSEAGEPTGA